MIILAVIYWFSVFTYSEGNPADKTCPLDGCTLSKLCHLIKDVTQLRNDFEHLAINVSELSARGNSNAHDILKLKSNEVLMKAELANLQQENGNLKQKVNQLQQDTEKNKLVVKNISKAVSSLEKEVSFLKERNTKFEEDIGDIRKLIAKLNKTKSDDIPRQREEHEVIYGARRNAVVAPMIMKFEIVVIAPMIMIFDTVIPPRDCSSWKKKGYVKNGIYDIQPDSKGSFKVYCDMTTAGGGWTVIQRRADGSVDFYRNWNDYKVGFGRSLYGEFWLGNDKIQRIVSGKKRQIIRFDLQDWKGDTRYAQYASFSIGSEDNKYKLSVTGYSGTAGDSFGPQNNMFFTTKDKDNDALPAHNCANSYKGGWWYGACHRSNLNGLYLNGPHKSYANGIEWYDWHGYYNSLTRTEMKIRPFSN